MESVILFNFGLPSHDQQLCHDIISIQTIDIYLEEDQIRAKAGRTSFPRGFTNRFVDRYGSKQFALINFDAGVSSRKIQVILATGVIIDSVLYSFLGCSSTGLKNRKCYLWRGSKEEAANVVQENGDFRGFTSVSKMTSRVGLLFSGCKMAIRISSKKVRIIDDIESRDRKYNFTDGCGFIGARLLREILTSCDGPDDLPSVLQIRFQGCKGILCLNTEIDPDIMMLRHSMIKFSCTSHDRLGVIDWSRPFVYGKLNRQYICLLSACGIPDEVFLQKQQDHFHICDSLFTDRELANTMLLDSGVSNAVLMKNDFNSTMIQQILYTIRRDLLSSPEKLRLVVRDSRLLYGVCDTNGILQYGQCMVRLTIRGEPRSLKGLIVVCKNPCYLRGDIRVLNCVDSSDIPQLITMEKDLVDCIVFPTLGPRPHAHEIAGSDLDGDKFIVFWDESLIPLSTVKPYDYPSAPERKSSSEITQEALIKYFAEQSVTSSVVSRIDSYYKSWADINGAGCEECERLGQLFARAIDASKSGEAVLLPRSLRPPLQEGEGEGEGGGEGDPSNIQQVDSTVALFSQSCEMKCSARVWTSMITIALERQALMQQQTIEEIVSGAYSVNELSEEFVLSMLMDRNSRLSEYELFEFLCAWLHQQEINLTPKLHPFREQLLQHINFSRFANSELAFAISRLGNDERIFNALYKTKLLFKREIMNLQLNDPFRKWKL